MANTNLIDKSQEKKIICNALLFPIKIKMFEIFIFGL